tara:strand:- start:159278 stop:160351 length:1074 start_codon:yes stop_codon:yes gene_type:complete
LTNHLLHKDFRLNGRSFTSKIDLLRHAESISIPLHSVIEEWLSDTPTIELKTSGSTGKAKVIQVEKQQVIHSIKATSSYFDLSSGSKVLHCLPLQYVAGKIMLLRAINMGWELDLVSPTSNPEIQPDKTYDFAAMVPLQLENSLLHLKFINKLIVGGGAVSNALKDKLSNVDCQVFETYGMTETITHIAVKPINHVHAESYFMVLPNVEIFTDERNCLVIKAPKISKEIIVTNDVVQLISNCKFQWLGRFDNIINSGGVKLNPEEIESHLRSILKERFFVAGMPDRKLGEKLVLVVEGQPKSAEQKVQLIEKIKKLTILHKYQKPKEIYFVEPFKETTSGKIQRQLTLEVHDLVPKA